MNKLLGLFLLALACWAPDIAQAANRFLTCNTTCTITAVDTSIWGTVSGGTGASVPGSSDDVVLDASTCVGGTTCTATFGTGYNPTWQTLAMTACTASTAGCILDANPNSNTITLTGVSGLGNNGSGTRTISGGTWVLTNNAASWVTAASGTITNSPSIQFTGTGGTTSRRFTGGGKTYGTITVVGGTSAFIVSGANTIGTLTLTGGATRINLPSATTQTITTLTNATGTVSDPLLIVGDNPTNGVATISSANNWTCDYCGFQGMTFSGGGTFSGTNSYNFGNNTGITISAPSVGGGGGKIIGG